MGRIPCGTRRRCTVDSILIDEVPRALGLSYHKPGKVFGLWIGWLTQTTRHIDRHRLRGWFEQNQDAERYGCPAKALLDKIIDQ